MNTIKPKIYDRFRCIGGDCSMTCCQEWKIAVDDETFRRWKKTKAPSSMNGANARNMSFFTVHKDGERVVCLDHHQKCPFLDERGLCHIVCEYGDDLLSKTCQRFPREIHEFDDRTEYTLMPACPEVLDFLHEQTDAMELVIEGEAPKGDALFEIRKHFMEIMADEAYRPEQAFLVIFYLVRELLLGKMSPEQAFQETFVKELAAEIAQMETNPIDRIYEQLELFLDLAENYRTEGLYTRILEPLAELAEEVIKEEEEEEIEKEEKEFAAWWKEEEEFLRRLWIEEIWADTLLPEGDLESMVLHLQWIALEMAAIRGAAFLRWKSEKCLPYEAFREVILTICRMTGYDEDDIREYLENSFEEFFWTFGYPALIIGN